MVAILSTNFAPKGAASGQTRGTKLRSAEETFMIGPDGLPTLPSFEVDYFLAVDRMVVQSLAFLFSYTNHCRKTFSASATAVVEGTAGRVRSLGNKDGGTKQEERDLVDFSTTDLISIADGERDELMD